MHCLGRMEPFQRASRPAIDWNGVRKIVFPHFRVSVKTPDLSFVFDHLEKSCYSENRNTAKSYFKEV
jgi:hypothetical protein